MARTNCRHLFKNKGNLVYNYKLKKYEHMSETPMLDDFYYLQSIKKDYLNMPLNKKCFIYQSRINVKEGLNTDLKTSELMLDKYDKEVYQSCRYCHQVIEIKKDFKEDASICNMCFKLLQMWIKLILKYTLYGQKTKNIGFLHTCIVLMLIVYSDMKILKINLVKFLKK